MNFAESVLALTATVSTALGGLVFAANHRRTANQTYLLLALTIAGWLWCVLSVFRSTTPNEAADWICCASIVGGFLPVAISLVRVSVVLPTVDLLRILKRVPLRLALYLLIAAYTLTPFYLKGAELRPEGVPDAVYGSFSLLFPAYFIGSLIWILREIIRDVSSSAGITRIELEFVLAGVLCLIGAGVLAGVLPLIVHSSQIVSLAPLCFVAMNAIVAYGVATKRILSVEALVRRAVSYGLVAAYLSAVFALGWWAASRLATLIGIESSFVSPLAGALLAAFSMGSANSILQAFVRRVFINIHAIDLSRTLKMAERILTHITTTDDLLKQFVLLLSRTAGTDYVTVQLLQAHEQKRFWSTRDGEEAPRNSNLLDFLRHDPAPLSSALAPRRRHEPHLAHAVSQLKEAGGTLALPIVSHGSLAGVVTLGEKLSGRVYDSAEEEALQLLVHRLAVALENSELYTEQRRSKQYLETLFSELTSGVIAADGTGRITVFNEEAERVLALSRLATTGASIAALPEPFSTVLQETLASGNGERDCQGTVILGTTAVPVRYSTQILPKSAGAFLVFEDLTQVRLLEEQVRRSDRLALLGTLAAGLAHEIRNPLAPIRTFASLIPERKEDTEFLGRFSTLVLAQVARIERLVERLLSFSRTGKERLRRSSVGMHELTDEVLDLLAHDLNKRSVHIEKTYCAADDHVLGDRQQLEQVLLNIFMNAGEAMSAGGTLRITTHSRKGHLELAVYDSGPGFPPEVLPRAFDPFVTSKESGTGLGLSIAYGIVAEHHGELEALNLPEGACVTLRLPLDQLNQLAA